MIGSLRVRLALWFAFALALGIAGLGWFVYSYVAQASSARIDQGLANVAAAFAQLSGTRRPTEEMLSEARADNFEVVVFDEAQREIASNSRSVRLHRSRHVAPAEAARSDSLLLRPDLAPLFYRARTAGSAYATLAGPLGHERAYAVAITRPGRREIVAVIQGLESEMGMLRALRRSFYWSIPIGLVLAFAGGTFVAGRALRPVGAMADQAGRIEARTLHERLPISNPGDELGQLSAAFNRLLDRLETAFEQQRRFMAEASHELRTPIAVVRGEADLALSKSNRDEAAYREALAVIAAETRRMTRVVEDLFLLARADGGELKLDVQPLDLGALAVSCARSAQSLASVRSMTITARASGELKLKGDETLIGRVVRNLVDNAIRYGREGGAIEIEASRDDGIATVAVRDDGPGMAPRVQQRIFDRFYRGPDARAADDAGSGGGAGLGLAIARGIAEAHGGTVTLHHSDPHGTEFRLTLPYSS